MGSSLKRRVTGLALAALMFLCCNFVIISRFLGGGALTGVLLGGVSASLLLLFAIYPVGGKSTFRLKVLYGGCRLLLLGACCWGLEAGLGIAAACTGRYGDSLGLFLVNGLIAFVLISLLMGVGFWRVMVISRQAGILLRVAVLFTWWIPLVNLLTVGRLYHKAMLEYLVETEKLCLDSVRVENEICRTRYPLLMVHGVFFRDWQYFNYWGRIPEELKRNGAEIFYGKQRSAASVADSGGELLRQIESIVRETGCEKVNLIAHSKGGLDSRYAISKLGAAPCVASLTTVNTPHRGCIWAQKVLDGVPAALTDFVARRYNAMFRKLGDESPDFLGAVRSLTAESCAGLDAEMPDREGILYQSVMTVMSGPLSGRFPLNLSYLLVRRYDGENDGLVGSWSVDHGSFLGTMTSRGRRGISHGDVIDLNRENFRGFDVREFYVQLVKGLKEKGL